MTDLDKLAALAAAAQERHSRREVWVTEPTPYVHGSVTITSDPRTPSPEPTPGLRETIDGAIRDVFMVDVQPGPSQIVDAVLAALAASPAPEPPCAGCAVFHDLGHPDHVPIDGAAPEPTGLDVERLPDNYAVRAVRELQDERDMLARLLSECGDERSALVGENTELAARLTARAAAPSVEPRTHDFDGREWCRWCKGTDENAPCVPASPEPTPGFGARAAAPSVEPCEQCEMWRKQYNSDIANGLVGAAKRYLRMIDAHVRAHVPVASPEPTPGLRERIHAHRDGCNGRPHRRWYRGENKCDTLAALAASPAPEPTGLDVERLRKAMDVVVPESIPPLYWTNERLAVALAAEYARLTDSGATDGE